MRGHLTICVRSLRASFEKLCGVVNERPHLRGQQCASDVRQANLRSRICDLKLFQQTNESSGLYVLLNKGYWQHANTKSFEQNVPIKNGVIRRNLIVDRERGVFLLHSKGDKWLVHRRRNSDEHMVRQVSRMPRPGTPVQVSFRCNDDERQPLQKPRHSQIRRQHERQDDTEIVTVSRQVDGPLR